MISDETFPIDLEYEPNTNVSNTVTCASIETFENSNFSSENYPSSTDISICPISSKGKNEKTPKGFLECSFASFDQSNGKMTYPPPKTPVKKKKFNSCQELSKRNYDHVESKVMMNTYFFSIKSNKSNQ